MSKKGTTIEPKQGRHVITVRREVFDKICEARDLANRLNAEASLSMPMYKSGKWTLSEILDLMATDWIQATEAANKSANKAIDSALSRALKKTRQ